MISMKERKGGGMGVRGSSVGSRCRSQCHKSLSKKANDGYLYMLAKLDPKVGSRRTTKIKNLIVLIIIVVALVVLPYHIYVVLALVPLFLFVRER